VIITNLYNLPEQIERFARSDKYSRGDADISVTTLIDAPRINKLRELHAKELSVDLSERVWSLFGTAVHHILEEAGETPDTVHEERIFTKFNNWTLSGAIDVQRTKSDGTLALMDYKVCSVWSVLSNKPDWERQLNCYAWLIRREKQIEVTDLQICAFVRDWSRRKASYDDNYPDSPIAVIDVPVWDYEKQEEYVLERVIKHQSAQTTFDFADPLPLCTDEERWAKPSKWAVMRDGRKTAIKVYDTEEEAMLHIKVADKPDGLYVDHRKGEFIRCAGNFCGVAEFCEQYKGDENV